MTLYKQTLEVREINQKILEEYKTEPGWFNNPHVLLVGLNPKLTKNSISDYDLISTYVKENSTDKNKFERQHERAYRSIITSWAKKVDSPLNYLINLNSPWVSYTNLVKVPTVGEQEIPVQEYAKWTNITKEQIEVFNPNLVLIFSKRAAKLLIGEQAEVGQFYEIEGITYYVMYHYAYFSRRGGNAVAFKYFMQERAKINEYLKYNCVIKVTDTYVYYLDIDGKKQKYENPIRFGNLYYVPDPEGTFMSVYGDRLKVGDPKDNPKKYKSFDANLHRSTWFLLKNKVRYTKYYHIISFDIETNFCNTPDNPTGEVLVISLVDSEEDKKVTFVLKNHKDQVVKASGEVYAFDLEEDMFRAFFSYLHQGFDVLTGWYSNGFDVPYVYNRAVKIGMQPSIYISGFSVKQKRDNTWSLSCEDAYLFDSLDEYKSATSGGAKSYALNSIAKELFDDHKLDVAPSQIPGLWKNDINRLVDYCIKDTELLSRIIAKADVFVRIRVLQGICPINADHAHFHSRLIEMSLRYDNPDLKFPTKVYDEDDGNTASGIIVLSPNPGLKDNEVVFDFAGMYASMITSLNISPDRLTVKEDNVTKIGNTKFDVSKIGVIPALELKIISLRKEQERLRDRYDPRHSKYKEYSLKRDYIKTFGNSVYGVLLYKKFILYSPPTAQAILDAENLLITFIKHYVENTNKHVDYGDTDSIFVNFPGKYTVDKLIKEADAFVEDLNKALKEYVRTITTDEQILRVYTISVGVDKIYSKFYMTDKKKRYFGFVVAKKGKKYEKPEIDVTGFETRRKDTPEFFKPIYLGLYSLVLNKKIDEISRFAQAVKTTLMKKDTQALISRLKLGKNVGDLDSDDIDKQMGDYKVKSTSWKAVMNGGVKIYRGDTLNLVYTKTGPTNYVGQPVDVDYELYYNKFFVEKVRLVSKDLYNLIKPETTRKRKQKKRKPIEASLDEFQSA